MNAEGVCHLQVRKHFYADAVTAMQAALGAGRSRIRLRCIIPELNVVTDGERSAPTCVAVSISNSAKAKDDSRVSMVPACAQ
jgi:hypothetical protein